MLLQLYNLEFANRIIAELNTSSNTTEKGPGLYKQLGNLLEAAERFISDGFHFVSKEEYIHRLTKCTTCPLRDHKKCTHEDCGCDITVKAMIASQHCPKKEKEW